MGRINRWRSTIAYVILAAAIALALWQNRLDAQAQARTLRIACEDRNDRDRQIAYGLARVAARLDAQPDDMAPILDALAPRDCDRLYPVR